MIKVSVIVPVYKVPLEYLRACLDSLTAQTMQECEFIIVSDGAPEAECSICDEYTSKDARFKFFKQEHAGVSAARNFGIEQAQGEYITFVDADDWIEPNLCTSSYKYAKESESDIVLWEAAQNNNGIIKTSYFSNNRINKLSVEQIETIISNIIYTTSTRYNSASLVCCKLFKKELIILNNIRYPEELTLSEDRVFNILAYRKTKKISYLNSVMYFYRIHNQSTSHKYISDAFEKYCNFICFLDKKTIEKHTNAINNEIIRVYFLSWSSCYMHKDNSLSFKQRMNILENITKSPIMQKATSMCNLVCFSLIIRIELKCFKNHFFFPIYIHGLKKQIVNLFKRMKNI
jgi:glycosyltransferase involved in cell wall biosynthesis